MSDFENILNADGLELEKVVEEVTESKTTTNKKTTVGKTRPAPKREVNDPDLEPEDMDIVEVTTENSETFSVVKKATAVKAKPAPKS